MPAELWPDPPLAIDADGHIVEPDELWDHYLTRQHRPLAPRWVVDSEGRTRRMVGGHLQPWFPFGDYQADPVAGASDPGERLVDMDRLGIAVSVLLPSAGLHFAALDDAGVVEALCRAYNNWLHDFCAGDRSRLKGVAVVPQSDPQKAADEAERAVSDLGHIAVMLRPNPIAGRTLDHPAFDTLWATIEALDVPIVVHEATTLNVTQAGRDRYANYLYLHAITHPHEHQMACLSLICGGVLERFPGLRVAFVEAGCGWVPYWLERLDQHVRYWGHASRPLDLLPSEYFQRQCFVTPFPDERTIAVVAEMVGEGNLVFSTDYPYPYVDRARVARIIPERDELPVSLRRRIHSENARRLYRL